MTRRCYISNEDLFFLDITELNLRSFSRFDKAENKSLKYD